MMEGRQRRFSTIQQINPTTLKVISTDERLRSIPDIEDIEGATSSAAAGVTSRDRKQSIPQILSSKLNSLALFRDDEDEAARAPGHGSAIIGGYTIPGPSEIASREKKKANLGVMLGVYLPTIQHILGVTMFIRLFWVVGIAGIWHTMLILMLCCTCVSVPSSVWMLTGFCFICSFQQKYPEGH